MPYTDLLLCIRSEWLPPPENSSAQYSRLLSPLSWLLDGTTGRTPVSCGGWSTFSTIGTVRWTTAGNCCWELPINADERVGGGASVVAFSPSPGKSGFKLLKPPDDTEEVLCRWNSLPEEKGFPMGCWVQKLDGGIYRRRDLTQGQRFGKIL